MEVWDRKSGFYSKQQTGLKTAESRPIVTQGHCRKYFEKENRKQEYIQ